ncbi:MAG: DNA polymerase I [Bacteroidales bacterium]|jgi:DNA polymerase-1|nr:DNA polymerase I [Bacteroidales bacterium]
MSKKLFLLDAYALIYRSYYAFIKNPRINSKGMNTSAAFGFTMTLDELLKKEQPTHIGVVFDPPAPSFRRDIYPEYKAQRPPTPEDIKSAIPVIKDIIKAFNIPVIQVDKYEADDVVGTLAKKALAEDFTVYMMTPDKDYAQIVEDGIFMYKPKRSGNDAEILGVEEVKEMFGIETPLQVIDILALMGDASDNIPGANGIGPKTAKKLIAKYGSVEELYENLSDLKGKQLENLTLGKDNVLLSKTLATIALDAPIDFKAEEFKIEEFNFKVLSELFAELEFSGLAKRIIPSFTETPKPAEGPVQTSLFGDDVNNEPAFVSSYKSVNDTEHEYICVDTDSDIEKLVETLSACDNICFDTETTSLNALTAEIVGVSFSVEKGKAWYIPLSANRDEAIRVLGILRPLFENDSIAKTGQNIKYDIHVLNNYNIEVKGKLYDTMIAHYLISPDQKHNMDFLAQYYLNYSPISIETLIGKGKAQKSMRDVSVDKVTEYAAEDADITWQLKDLIFAELEEKGLSELYWTIEEPLIRVLAAMERRGIYLDVDIINSFTDDLRKDVIKLEEEVRNLAEEPELNVSSPKQLGVVLFEKLALDAKAKKTKTKQYSTSEETLQKLKDKHPIIEKILEFRGVKKLLTTYIEPLPALVNGDNKIHTSYNQAVAATGRLSSTNPNLQNIPIREDRGMKVREAFVPGEGCTLLSADYSQIELRIMAHMSGDENLIDAFMEGKDIHTATAAKIFGKSHDEVTRDERSKAKTANFGIIYGISAFGLSQRLNISRKEAKELIDGYFASFPKVKEYMNNCIEEARKKEYVETLYGRKRMLRDINSRNAIVRGVAERNAINAPIQGTAADIIKLAMINVRKSILDKGLKTGMVLQVHDELILDVSNDELDIVKDIVVNEMQSVASLKVPLLVDFGTGNNWLEAH